MCRYYRRLRCLCIQSRRSTPEVETGWSECSPLHSMQRLSITPSSAFQPTTITNGDTTKRRAGDSIDGAISPSLTDQPCPEPNVPRFLNNTDAVVEFSTRNPWPHLWCGSIL